MKTLLPKNLRTADLKYLESQTNWQATFYQPNARDKVICLMRTITGGYYYSIVDYKGLFVCWGAATGDVNFKWWAATIKNGDRILVKGEIPEEIQEKLKYC